MTKAIRTAVIIGSIREGRFGPTVADWFIDRLRQREDIDPDIIDLAKIALPAVLPETPAPAIAAYLDRIVLADAFVMITPEYNHSFPASLKQAIDVGDEAWHAKPVGFVSYGGLAAGLRAVEHLRAVMAELHAVTIRDTVSFQNPWDRFDESGRLRDGEAAEAATDVLLDRLAWWAEALRAARAARPYKARQGD